MRRIILTIGLAVLLFDLARTAQAEWVTIQIEGVIDYVEDYGNYLGGKVNVGSTMTGWYTYDTTVPDSEPWEKVGRYKQNNSPAGIHFDTEGFSFNTTPDSLDFYVDITNDNAHYLGDFQDVYQIGSSYDNLPFKEGVPIDGIGLGLLDYSGNALSSDALPITIPNLQDWQENGFWVGSDRNFNIRGTITAMVPEPASILILSFGALSLFTRKAKGK